MNNDTQEPEAMRYDFDGFGWQYIDSGSGSDWQTRHPDAEPLYASLAAQDGLVDALRACVEYMEFKVTPNGEPYPLQKAKAALASIEVKS